VEGGKFPSRGGNFFERHLTKWRFRKGKVVGIAFFGGLNIEETAEVVAISRATVRREWSTATAWLYRDNSNSVTGDE